MRTSSHSESEPLGRVELAPSSDGLVIISLADHAALDVARQLKTALPGAFIRASRTRVTVRAANWSALSTVPGLSWDDAAMTYVQNRSAAPEAHRRIRESLADIAAGGRRRAAELLQDVSGLSVLDDHQWVAVAAMVTQGGYGLSLFDEQGTGKTVTLIHAFDVLVARRQADILLVVAPKSMVSEWVRDFRRFKGGLYTIRVLSGTTHQKRQQLAAGGDVFVTNFETAIAMETELRLLLKRHRQRAVLAVDESYNIKNAEALRTRALQRLREWCGRAYVLCGTPAPNAARDIVEQITLVDFGSTFDGVAIPTDRTAAKAVIQGALRDRGAYVRNLKADVLPWLPKKQFHRITIPFQPLQERIYSQALTGLLEDLRATDDLTFRRSYTSYLARRAALLQVCSNPRGIAEGYTEIPAKLMVLDGLIEDAATRREKVVVWSAYRASIDAIVQRYSHFGLVRYDGSVTDVDERGEIVRRFQDDDATMVFVGNPAAAGAGLTLHSARLSVYESLSLQAAHYLQSIDRIHRRGQHRQVEYFVILCDRSLEVAEYERLIGKQTAGQELLGDQVVPPVTRETFIAELQEAARLIGDGAT